MSKTVLVLDPDDPYWVTTCQNMEQLGYRFFRAWDIQEMKQILEKQKIDAVMKQAPLSSDEKAELRQHKVEVVIIQKWLDYITEYKEKKCTNSV